MNEVLFTVCIVVTIILSLFSQFYLYHCYNCYFLCYYVGWIWDWEKEEKEVMGREREHHFLLKKACVQEGLLFLVWLSLVLTWKSVTVAINSQDCKFDYWSLVTYNWYLLFLHVRKFIFVLIKRKNKNIGFIRISTNIDCVFLSLFKFIQAIKTPRLHIRGVLTMLVYLFYQMNFAFPVRILKISRHIFSELKPT